MASKVLIEDFRWEKGLCADELLERMGNIGYQAAELKKAADIILTMKKDGAKIFLSYTSNMVSSGLRGLFSQMIELGLVDVVVTTVGSIEEDFIKDCGGEFLKGEYSADDCDLSKKDINRIGNIFVPSNCYSSFENDIKPILQEIIEEFKDPAPSEITKGIGKRCKKESSILRQAYLRGVPIYCPAITDGSLGYQLQELRNEKKFQIDILKDMKNIAFEASPEERIGLIVFGGGVAKHHAILANITNGGADYAVYVTTASQYSGSLSGATTDEAKSWGKVKDSGMTATVHGEASIVAPLLLSYVFERL